MMIINSLRRRGPRTRRTVIGLMVAVMGARMVVLALAAVGVMSWGGSGQAASWMPLVLLPMLVIRRRSALRAKGNDAPPHVW